MQEKKYYVYVLGSQKLSRLYIGQTKKLKERLKEHNFGRVRSTKYYLPWQLIGCEVYNTRREARKRENYLKSLKNKDYLLKTIKKVTDAG
ncbi:MAG: GIY-YIG nuclease family protein [Candidatus Buchananbacteria bacterium]|jgi:putative endonuclease